MIQPDPEWAMLSASKKGQPQSLIDLLAQVRTFEMLTFNDLSFLSQFLHVRYYMPGECIVRQLGAGSAMYVIESGAVKVILEDAVRGDIELAVLDAQDTNAFFGEMSLLDGEPRAATVLALEPVKAWCFTQEDLMSVVHKKPDLGFKLIMQMTQTLMDRLRNSLTEVRRLMHRLKSY
jgi:CRP/FNR family transcriptional regulator, cyclic AMP receptor protein